PKPGLELSGSYVPAAGATPTEFTVPVVAGTTGTTELQPNVSVNTSMVFSVSLNGSELSKTITVSPGPAPPALKSISLTPNPVKLGKKVTANLTLTGKVTASSHIAIPIFSGNTATGIPVATINATVQKNSASATGSLTVPTIVP